MRDNPIPGVPFNSYEGVQTYKRAMGLEANGNLQLLDIESIAKVPLKTEQVINDFPQDEERIMEDQVMGDVGVGYSLFGQATTDDLLSKYTLAPEIGHLGSE